MLLASLQWPDWYEFVHPHAEDAESDEEADETEQSVLWDVTRIVGGIYIYIYR